MVQHIKMLFAPYDRAVLVVHSLCGSWASCPACHAVCWYSRL